MDPSCVIAPWVRRKGTAMAEKQDGPEPGGTGEEGKPARTQGRVTREELIALFATHLRPGRSPQISSV